MKIDDRPATVMSSSKSPEASNSSSSSSKSPKASESSSSSKSPKASEPPPKLENRTDPKADEIMKQADKVLSTFSFSRLFSGSGNKKEDDAVELILKAAALYKVNKNWQEAGDAFVKAAQLYENKLNEPHDACTKYVEAARAYKNIDVSMAIRYYKVAVNMHMENTKFSLAAKLWKDIAELQEKELDYEAAKYSWEQAAKCYDSEDSVANATTCHVKVAALMAELEDFKGAIRVYEEVSNKALQGSSAGRWGVKDYLYKSLLCHLVLGAQKGDMALTTEAVEKYQDMLPQMAGTREIKFIESLVEAYNEDDVDKFSDAVFKHDEIYRLDNWSAKVLLQVKNILKNGPQGEAPPDDFS